MEKVSSSSGVSLVGAARGKFVESLGEQRLKEMVHRTRHPTNVHHYQHLARQYWLELGYEAISGPGRPLYKELGTKLINLFRKGEISLLVCSEKSKCAQLHPNISKIVSSGIVPDTAC